MKKSVLLVVIASFALNAVLGWLLITGLSSPVSPKAETTAPSPATVGSAGPGKIDPDVWPSLQTDDLATLTGRLRAAGFPRDIVRAIVAAQLGELYAARRKALDPDADTLPFWKTRKPDVARDTALRQLSREQGKALEALLGEDADQDPMSLAYQQRSVSGVPPEKVDQVRQLIRDYNEKRQDLYSSFTSMSAMGMLTLDRDKLSALEKAQHAALAQILTPAEMAEYDLRNSNTASQLRFELTAFNATEAEFRQLYQLKQPFDERYAFNGNQPTQEEMRARSEAQKQLNEQIKAALGPQRAEEYMRATDYNYRQTNQLVTRLELPAETTNQVWTVQKDIQQRSQSLDRSLPPEERAQQLAALADEAKTKITAALGDRGFQAYKQYGGQWMQSLQPRPAPATGGTNLVPVR